MNTTSQPLKADHINPFLKSTIETFKVMIGLLVTPGKLYLRKEPNNADISSLIELSGDIKGSLVIAYPLDSALKISSKFLGEDIKELNANVADCIGEISNIITGYAKKDMPSMQLSLSLPSILRGKHDAHAPIKDIPVIGIPFDSEVGSFIVEIKMSYRC